MPAMFEAIRASLLREGKAPRTANRIAAIAFNKQRKPGQAPVTGKHKAEHGRKK